MAQPRAQSGYKGGTRRVSRKWHTHEMKEKRFPLHFGSESSATWPSGPLPIAKGYDFDPQATYPVLLDEEEAGHCRVERDLSSNLWVVPDFQIVIEDVEFLAFWHVKGDKAMLSSVLLKVRR